MRLYHTGPSPYGRKVFVTAIECGLLDRIKVIQTNPHESEPQLVALNPLSKVPTLVRDDGMVLFDSFLICEYLDSLHDGARLFPPAGDARWACMRRYVLANGVIDFSVTRRVEGWRAQEPDRLKHIQRMITNTARTLDVFEREVGDMQALQFDQVTLGCALGFLDFRFPGDRWRDGRPNLAAWFEKFERRQSMILTKPQDIPK